MKRTTAIVGASLSAIAALVLASCGSGAKAAGTSTAPSTGGTAEPVTLTYWATNQADSISDDEQILKPALDKFTADTGIKVDLEVIDWNTIQTRIQTAATSGQAPDVTNIGNSWAASFQATGAFLPFDQEEMAAIGGSDKFNQAALATGGAAGTAPTSIPIYGDVYLLYYNKAMFADAGLKPPTTYEEMLTDATKLTDPGKDVWGLCLAAGSYTENIHFAFINAAQNGADFFGADGAPTFVSDGTVNGILRYVNLMQSDKVVNVADAEYDDSTKCASDFANHKAAMIITQSDGFGTLSSQGMDKDSYDVVGYPAPANAAADISTFIAGINISIFKNTKHKDAALQFVKYMTSKAVQAQLNGAYKSLPVLKGMSPSLGDTVPADAAMVLGDVFDNHAKALPVVPAEAAFETAVGKAMNQMFATAATGGTVTADDVRSALTTAQQEVADSVG